MLTVCIIINISKAIIRGYYNKSIVDFVLYNLGQVGYWVFIVDGYFVSS